MKKMKIFSAVLASLSASAAFAQLAPGTYTDEILADTAFANPAGDASWLLDGSSFANNVAYNHNGGSADSSYLVQLKSSSMTFSSFYLGRNASGSTSVFELVGTQDARASLTGTNDVWTFKLDAVGDSSTTNELRLSGYSDFRARNFKITSDSITGSGSAGVSISGASNTFTSTDNVFINYLGHSNAFKLYFDISGLEGAKSSATFETALTIRTTASSTAKFRMLGNADFTVGGVFALGDASTGGRADFLITGSNNKFETTAGGNSFLVGADLDGADAFFSLGGKNNTLRIAGGAYVGTSRAGLSSQAVLEIKGSGHTINFNGGLTVRNSDDSKGILRFAADADGFSTLNASGISVSTLEIALGDFVGDIEGGTYVFTLISSASAWNMDSFLGSGTADSDIIAMGATGISWELSKSGNDLVLTYVYGAIPEPSTYAAIFGAIVLSLAVYRRRK